jgi:hypothetical protein
VEDPRTRPRGVAVISVWLEPSAGRSTERALRARITTTDDAAAPDPRSEAVAGREAVLATLERWLVEWSSRR